ncbi:MAG: hypothetical protein N2036_09410 [Bryobacteraceae bacterium]|nr:hypothetical protein [Bryobacteraceae bacterium]MCX7604279.1 hypothetical protein [Bryobacteraceae bacterium]
MKTTATVVLALSLAAPAVIAALEDPPPQHVKWMKESAELQDRIRNGQDVQASARRMEALYKEVEAFWAKRNSEVAVKACRDIQAAAAKVAAGDAGAGRAIGAGCRSCHDQHREKISDTVYKIK